MTKELPKQKILIFIDWFLPGYKAGGPVRSMANLVEYLKEDYEFYIYTSNVDHDSTLLQIENDKWIDFGDGAAQVFYSSNPGFGEVRQVLMDLQPDVVYLNSIFSLKFTLLPLFFNRFCSKIKIQKVVFAPRGMFQRGALQLKAVKKRLFLKLVKPLLFRVENIVWHATDKQELEDVKEEIGEGASICEVSNIPTTKVNDYGISLLDKEIRFVTISLVAEKKNHLFFLQLLKGIAIPKGKRVIYDIYGPIKDEAYWKRCEELMKELPEGVEVNYQGSVIPTKVNETLQAYHFFVLPTLGENFGHAIFEALVNRVPVLISDRTPWKGLVKNKGGWDIPLEMKSERVEKYKVELEDREQKTEETLLKSSSMSGVEGDAELEQRWSRREGKNIYQNEVRDKVKTWQAVLEEIISMPPEEHQQWKEGAKAVAQKYIADQDYRNAYKRLLGYRPR
jgi:hypothetical protein